MFRVTYLSVRQRKDVKQPHLIGEKTLKKDEFLAIFKEAKNIKDSGVYEDFIECLKLYDKAENGTMLGAELSHILISLGKN